MSSVMEFEATKLEETAPSDTLSIVTRLNHDAIRQSNLFVSRPFRDNSFEEFDGHR